MWAMIPQSPTRFPSSTHSCFRVTWASCVEDGQHLSPPSLVLVLHPAGGSAKPPGFPDRARGLCPLWSEALCSVLWGASATWVPLCWEPGSIAGGRTKLWLTLYSKPSTSGRFMFADECRPLQIQLRLFQIKRGWDPAHFPMCPGQIITG